MTTYVAHHTLDMQGVPYAGDGPVDYRGPDLTAAMLAADHRTAMGQNGYVRRECDGAILALDGTWVGGRAPPRLFVIGRGGSRKRYLDS